MSAVLIEDLQVCLLLSSSPSSCPAHFIEHPVHAWLHITRGVQEKTHNVFVDTEERAWAKQFIHFRDKPVFASIHLTFKVAQCT